MLGLGHTSVFEPFHKLKPCIQMEKGRGTDLLSTRFRPMHHWPSGISRLIKNRLYTEGKPCLLAFPSKRVETAFVQNKNEGMSFLFGKFLSSLQVPISIDYLDNLWRIIFCHRFLPIGKPLVYWDSSHEICSTITSWGKKITTCSFHKAYWDPIC